MKSQTLIALFFFLATSTSFAQNDLFQTQKGTPRQGFIIGINGQLDVPAADLASRWGIGYRLGPSLHYKSNTNWLFGVKLDLLLGNRVREDSLLVNVMNESQQAYNFNGDLVTLKIRRAGYVAGFFVGKVLDLGSANPDNGLVAQLGIGFMQHKFHFKAQDDEVPQIVKPYSKGYDRLTNGLYAEPYLGYQYMDGKGMLSFYVGMSATFGFTKGRRDYLFDVQRPDNANRLDMLWGIRGGIYLPIFKSKSEDIFF